jgi:hypothetical protein
VFDEHKIVFVYVLRRDLGICYSLLLLNEEFSVEVFVMHVLLLGEGPGNFRAKV